MVCNEEKTGQKGLWWYLSLVSVKVRISVGVASVRSAERSSKSGVVSVVFILVVGVWALVVSGVEVVEVVLLLKVGWTYHLGRLLED